MTQRKKETRKGGTASNIVDFAAHRAGERRERRDWPAIRARYVHGDESLEDLAGALAVPHSTVAKHARNLPENGHKTWLDLRSEFRARRDDLANEKALAVSSDTLAEALSATIGASKLAAEYAQQVLQAGIDGKIAPGERQSTADVFKAVMGGYAVFVSTTRDVAGKRPGDPSTIATDGAEATTFVRTVINRPEDLELA